MHLYDSDHHCNKNNASINAPPTTPFSERTSDIHNVSIQHQTTPTLQHTMTTPLTFLMHQSESTCWLSQKSNKNSSMLRTRACFLFQSPLNESNTPLRDLVTPPTHHTHSQCTVMGTHPPTNPTHTHSQCTVMGTHPPTNPTHTHSQCTVMGMLPDFLCTRCNSSIKSIIGRQSEGGVVLVHLVKWN